MFLKYVANNLLYRLHFSLKKLRLKTNICKLIIYFSVSRKLYPNVDFYSGLIYRAMGFPTDMYPVLFTIPRVAGWIAHWV
jgi:citrate synthase